jgi:hypothetical protein
MRSIESSVGQEIQSLKQGQMGLGGESAGEWDVFKKRELIQQMLWFLTSDPDRHKRSDTG